MVGMHLVDCSFKDAKFVFGGTSRCERSSKGTFIHLFQDGKLYAIE